MFYNRKITEFLHLLKVKNGTVFVLTKINITHNLKPDSTKVTLRKTCLSQRHIRKLIL